MRKGAGPILTPEIAKQFWPGGRVRVRPRGNKRGHLPKAYTDARLRYMKAATEAGWVTHAIAISLGVSRSLVEFLLSERKKNR